MIFTLPWLLFRHEWRSRTDHYLGNNWSRSRESGNFHRLRKTIFLVLFSLSLSFFSPSFFIASNFRELLFIFSIKLIEISLFLKPAFNLLCHNCVLFFLDSITLYVNCQRFLFYRKFYRTWNRDKQKLVFIIIWCVKNYFIFWIYLKSTKNIS